MEPPSIEDRPTKEKARQAKGGKNHQLMEGSYKQEEIISEGRLPKPHSLIQGDLL